jgi:protein-disulfide isomerase
VVRDFPLESIHPQALGAAEAARCAGEQGRFWPMHDRLFAHPDALDSESLLGHAAALGLDVAAFRRCLDSDRYAADIRREVQDARRLGITGTPTFLFGAPADGPDRVRVLGGARGALPWDDLRALIERYLGAASGR